MRLRLLPPFAVLLLAGLMVMLDQCWPVTQLIPPPFNWIGTFAIVAGIGMAHWHARHFRVIGTNINTFHDPDKLTTAGLFSRSRNPMYLGMLFSLIGTAWLLGSLTPWLGPLAFFALASGWYIPFEERAMASRFGADYHAYRQRVRRWL